MDCIIVFDIRRFYHSQFDEYAIDPQGKGPSAQSGEDTHGLVSIILARHVKAFLNVSFNVRSPKYLVE
jgi:hypothetical protein